MPETPKQLTIPIDATPYTCKNNECRRVLALVSGRVIGFPLIFGYTPLVELKKGDDYFPLVCACGEKNKIYAK